MKPPAVIVALLLSMFVFLVFHQGEKHTPEPSADRPSIAVTAVDLEADEEIERFISPKKSDVMTEAAKKQVEVMRERTSALGSAAALLITEEVQLGMVNKAMARLEELYLPLFNKWASPDAERQAILDIVREREARFISMRTAAQREGSEAVLKSIKLIEAERAAYAQRLGEFLGAERLRELTELDTQERSRFRVKLPDRD